MTSRSAARLTLAASAMLAAVTLVPSASAATTTSTSATSADAYVDSSSASTRYGSAQSLQVRNPKTRTSYLAFSLPADPGTVTSASLQLYATGSCSVAPSVGLVTASWSESTLTWNNRPPIGASIGRLPKRSSAGWTTLDVTTSVPASGVVSFGVLAPSKGSCAFASREAGAATAARLVVTRTTVDPSPSATATATANPTPTATSTATATPTPSPTPTTPPPADPVVAAVGDMACDPTDQNYNGGLGLGSYCRTAAVADLVGTMSPAALLALGDMQYEDGTLAKFQSSYAPAWSRFDSIVRPVIGNHEYLDPGAAGYFAYFGAKAGDPSQGWYSYDVGAWHIIVLNGECASVSGGCSAGSPQETWLKADLAAHSNACTMAMWHRPRFTSGEAQAATTPQGQATFWQDLYDAGADVVLAGHIHNYERFAPVAPDGSVDNARGLREFVIGTGGKSLVGFNATTWPSSQFRDSTHFGALRLELHPTSLDWQFLPIGGGPALDAGSQACH